MELDRTRLDYFLCTMGLVSPSIFDLELAQFHSEIRLKRLLINLCHELLETIVSTGLPKQYLFLKYENSEGSECKSLILNESEQGRFLALFRGPWSE